MTNDKGGEKKPPPHLKGKQKSQNIYMNNKCKLYIYVYNKNCSKQQMLHKHNGMYSFQLNKLEFYFLFNVQ
jgi:hypothetical protein